MQILSCKLFVLRTNHLEAFFKGVFFLKKTQNSNESTCARVFLKNLQASSLCILRFISLLENLFKVNIYLT